MHYDSFSLYLRQCQERMMPNSLPLRGDCGGIGFCFAHPLTDLYFLQLCTKPISPPLSLNNIYSHISYEVIIIEDNSPDGTLEVAQQLQVSRS